MSPLAGALFTSGPLSSNAHSNLQLHIFERSENRFLGEGRGRSVQDQLLYSPVRRFRCVDLVLRGTRQGMRTGELAEIAP